MKAESFPAEDKYPADPALITLDFRDRYAENPESALMAATQLFLDRAACHGRIAFLRVVLGEQKSPDPLPDRLPEEYHPLVAAIFDGTLIDDAVSLFADPVAIERMHHLLCDPDWLWTIHVKCMERIQRPEPVMVNIKSEQIRHARNHYVAFEQRKRWEELALDRITRSKELSHQVADSLRSWYEEMKHAHLEGDVERFIDADIQFHLTICGYAGLVPQAELDQVYDLIRSQGMKGVSQPAERQHVLDEHRAILERIQNDQGELASAALISHLHRSLNRWHPTLTRDIQVMNAERYTQMGKGHALWFFSLDEEPIEMIKECREVLGKAVADAVRRGAILLYLRPSQKFLQSMANRGYPLPAGLSEEAMQRQFKEFRRWVAGSGPGERLPAWAKERMIQFHLDRSAYMHFNKTYGMFRDARGKGRLTQREAITDNCTWPLIVDAPNPTNFEISQYTYEVEMALRSVARRKKGGKRAKSLLRLWFADNSRGGVPMSQE